jgi:hypothetical protein
MASARCILLLLLLQVLGFLAAASAPRSLNLDDVIPDEDDGEFSQSVITC